MVRTVVLLSALTLVGAASGPRAQGSDVSVDEYAVYGAVIDQFFTQGKGWLLIADRTASFNCNDEGIPLKLGACSGGMRAPEDAPAAALKAIGGRFARLKPSTLQDFGTRNGGGYVLTEKLPTSRKHYSFGATGSTSAPQGSPDFLFVFSRAGISADRTEALVYVAAATWLAGAPSGGFIILFSRRKRSWVMQRSIQTWEMTSH